MTFRTPRGYARQAFPYIERFHDGTKPSYPTKPALFLPFAAADELNNDPIVLLPGTWVGRLNASDHSDLSSTFLTGDPIAPACPVAYKVSYTASDLEASVYGGTPDLDVDANTIVTATGDTTATVAAVKPLGVVTSPIYNSWQETRFENYKRQDAVAWMTGGKIIRVPAITADEKAILPGDLVMLCDAMSPVYSPTEPAETDNTPGRLERAGASPNPAYVVGRCQNRVRLGRQAAFSAGQSLRTAIGTGAPRTLTNLSSSATYLWPDGEEFKVHAHTEVVPGTGLSASSQTMGRPSELLFAMPDASGDYWALDILVRV